MLEKHEHVGAIHESPFDVENHTMAQNQRKSIRLEHYNYSASGYYFVTICTHNRQSLFGEIIKGEVCLNGFGKVVEKWMECLPERYENVSLDIFIIMPNHVHMILIIEDNRKAIRESPLRKQRRNMTLSKVMGYLKMNSAKKINEMRNTSGTPLWQRNFYDHIIRNDKSLLNIREYIVNNPAAWEDDEYYV